MRVEVQGIKEVVGSLQKLNVETEKKIQQRINISAARVLADSKRNAPVAFGALRSSGNVKTGRLRAEVAFHAKYAMWVEFGRKPGKWPPKTPIADWVKKKGIASGKDVNGVAFLIQRKIGQKGTRPHPFLRPAFEKERARFKSGLVKIIK